MSEKEGELYKQIEKKIPKILKDYERNIKEYGWGAFSVEQLQSYAIEILDEAKADLESIITRMDNESDGSSMDYVYSYQRLVDKIKKWFGDVEKK